MFVDVKELPEFKVSDRVKLYLKYRNRWVDYCPSDGVSLNDENSICSFVTFTYNGFYYTLIKPNLREEYQKNCKECWKEDYNRFCVFKYKLNDLYAESNALNKSNSVHKVSKLEFNDESLFILLPNDPILNIRVDSEKEFQKEFKKVMKNLVV